MEDPIAEGSLGAVAGAGALLTTTTVSETDTIVNKDIAPNIENSVAILTASIENINETSADIVINDMLEKEVISTLKEIWS